jgi:hypothetical protein
MSSFATFTVSGFGLFPSETGGAMAGPIRQLELLACIAIQRPGALQKMLVFGATVHPA